VPKGCKYKKKLLEIINTSYKTSGSFGRDLGEIVSMIVISRKMLYYLARKLFILEIEK